MRKPRTALDKIERIEQVIRELDERFARLENAAHVPRSEPLPKGAIPTIFNKCDPSCPTCALQKRNYRHRGRLGSIWRAALVESVQDYYKDKERRRTANRANARKPRQRKEALWRRGFKRVLREDPEITAEGLRSWLDQMPRPYNDVDVRLHLNGEDIVVEDLITGQIHTVIKANQREYLLRVRNS